MTNPDFFCTPCAPFSAQVIAAACQHAGADPENETCGLVRSGAYVPCENVAEHRDRCFQIPDDVLADAYADGSLQGIIHSHPGGPWYPSAADMVSQIETAVPWAIIIPGEESGQLACHWGTQRPDVIDTDGHHLQRNFRHGVSDCYTLMQDYFAQRRDHVLPDIPRDWDWWSTGQNLYLDHLEEAGFDVVCRDPLRFAEIAQPGDAFLMSIRSQVPNHAGVYLGNNLHLDHLPNRLSRVSPVGRMLPHITHWLRLNDGC